MMRTPRMLSWLVPACALAIAAVPAHGHGPEGHDGEKAEATEQVEPTMQEAEPGARSASDAAQVSQAESAGEGEHEAEHEAESGGFWTTMENLHPATVHFPIALFIVAALLELLNMARPSTRLQSSVEIMAAAGAVGAVVAAIFGWIHTGLWFGGGADMLWHRWIGTGGAVAGIVVGWLALRGGEGRTLLRLALFALALAMVAQGYLGGELAHGTDHLA